MGEQRSSENGKQRDGHLIELTVDRLLYECCKMGWKPADFYNETISDIQIALAAYYDKVEFDMLDQKKTLRRLTYFIVNTGGFVSKEIEESQILELPHERAERERKKEENKYSDEKVADILDQWKKEGPGFERSENADKLLLSMIN